MNVIRRAAQTAAVLTCLLLLARCQANDTRSAEDSGGENVVRLNLPAEPLSLDPRFGETRSQIVIRMLFEGLTRIGRDGEPHPGIAESWEISPDQCTYTFKLREAFWSNGERVTAGDFVHSWTSTVSPDSGSPMAFPFEPLLNCRAVRSGKKELEELGVWAVSDEILVVELEHPTPYFLGLLANAVYSPIYAAGDRENSNWSSQGGTHFVSNGPYCMQRWDHGERILLASNPYYWDAATVQVDGIDISIVDDARTVLMMFERGELDWAGEPLSEMPLDSLPQIRKMGLLHTESSGAVYILQLNTQEMPFSSRSMRHAFANAINRKALVNRLLRGGEEPANTILLPRHTQCDASPVCDGDVALAREQFQQGLEELGLSAAELPPLVLTYGAREGQQTLAQAIQQQWEDAFHISIILEGLDWGTFVSGISEGTFQVGGVMWHSWLDDPVYNLEIVKYRGRGFNAAHWESPDYISLLDQADLERSKRRRQRYLRDAEHLVLEELPLVPVFVGTHKYVKNPDLQGVYINDLGQIDFKWAYFSRAANSSRTPH